MSVVYEQPLNERMRAFLRLEHLFRQAAQGQNSDADAPDDRTGLWTTRNAVSALIDITSLVGRIDLKPELIKELERQLNALESLQPNPHVDTARLESVLERLRHNLRGLRSINQAFGYELRSNELLNSVRQRNSIPAGTCDFDLPSYRFWLGHSTEQRNRDLTEWLGSYSLVREGVDLALSLVRSSADATTQTAPGGFFQMTLDGDHRCALVRVSVQPELPCFTEISAGKHRFTVRFMEQPKADVRATQTARDVEFQLSCCGL